MQAELDNVIQAALGQLDVSPDVDLEAYQSRIKIERTRDREHGDYACNVALMLAKPLQRKPHELATAIVAALPVTELIDHVEVAGPGFINFFLKRDARSRVISEALAAGDTFGGSELGQGERVQVEFVSANPTGPLHIGHGRGAAYGAVVANLLRACGFDVQTEYYVNDAGRQMDILAVSIWLRYLQLTGAQPTFPDNAYQGDYVKDIAGELHARDGARYQRADVAVAQNDDPEADLDQLIATAKASLGATDYAELQTFGTAQVLTGIRADLDDFGVRYDEWFSEKSLTANGIVSDTLQTLSARDAVYERDGAHWFRSSRWGDEKDRVVIKANQETTYLASDIAYHKHKFERGFARVIDIWGADHHGHVPRMKAALAALGLEPEQLEIRLVQFASLFRDKQRVAMSTRSGEFITLAELCAEVGTDAARFFYVMRKAEQHLDFDLDLAKSESTANPVYYIQYAHARVCSVFRQLRERGLNWDRAQGEANLALLTQSAEQRLISTVAKFPELIEAAAVGREPHLLAHYLRAAAGDFHGYYNAHKIIVDNAELRNSRLALIVAVQHVIANGLRLLGVTAPEHM